MSFNLNLFYSKISKKKNKQTISTLGCIYAFLLFHHKAIYYFMSKLDAQSLLMLDVVGVFSNCLGKDITQLVHFHCMLNLFMHLIELYPSAWSSTCLYVWIVLLHSKQWYVVQTQSISKMNYTVRMSFFFSLH